MINFAETKRGLAIDSPGSWLATYALGMLGLAEVASKPPRNFNYLWVESLLTFIADFAFCPGAGIASLYETSRSIIRSMLRLDLGTRLCASEHVQPRLGFRC